MSDKIKELYLMRSPDGTRKYSYQQIADQLGTTKEAVRTRIRKSDYYSPERKDDLLPESVTLKADGSQISERVMALTAKQKSTPSELIKAHGYDPNEWEIVSATSNLWHQQTQGGGQIPLYQSKINVKPRLDQWADIIHQIKQSAQKRILERSTGIQRDRHLLIGCNDLHFDGRVAYPESLSANLELIERGCDTAVIYLAGDLLDTDNLRGTTARGTPIGKIDMAKAWRDLSDYIEPMIETALKHAQSAKVVFVRGNHSESMEFAFTQYLKARYPQADIDDSLRYRKAITLGQNFIGLSHGYKRAKDLAVNFSKEYARLWGSCVNHEVIVGHKHKESVDEGVMLRVLPTRAPSSEYGDEENFLLYRQTFQTIEYDDVRSTAVYYV